ncbi:Cystinosin [Larimichthys crocea]|uniref:Uncharacterized protein n=1 Tax=Larimichthys crocea TaxID=215358 RepID=A0ACD3RMR2_LARCR|nr:Cystinosin [Larimichthys crocea]
MSGLDLAKRWLPAQLLFLWMLTNISESTVSLSAPDAVTLEEHSKANITITSSSPVNQSVVIQLNVSYTSKENYSSVITVPEQVLLPVEATSVTFNVTSHDVGQVTTYLVSNNTDFSSFPVRIRFIVVHSNAVSIISQEEFLKRNPHGINPVNANDVFFSLHAVLLCLIYIIQAAMYEVCLSSDEWGLVFGDPTKFGLGLFSVVFDILFITQHYCLYQKPPQYEVISEQRED